MALLTCPSTESRNLQEAQLVSQETILKVVSRKICRTKMKKEHNNTWFRRTMFHINILSTWGWPYLVACANRATRDAYHELRSKLQEQQRKAITLAQATTSVLYHSILGHTILPAFGLCFGFAEGWCLKGKQPNTPSRLCVCFCYCTFCMMFCPSKRNMVTWSLPGTWSSLQVCCTSTDLTEKTTRR